MITAKNEHRLFSSTLQVAALLLFIVGVLFFLQHQKTEKKLKAAELDLICTIAAAKPYQHSETTLACLRWSPVKSDIPLPAQGSPAY